MKINTLAKAIAATLIVGSSFGTHAAAPVAGASVAQIGCGLPAAGTAGAKVYSTDAYNNLGDSLTLSTVVAAGASCSQSLSAMSVGGWTISDVDNVVINGTGYSLQQFTFSYPSSPTAGPQLSLIGCAAPAAGTVGGGVYSIDALNNDGTTNALVGGIQAQSPCSKVLTGVKAGSYSTTLGTASLAVAGQSVIPMVQPNSGYSLQQIVIQ